MSGDLLSALAREREGYLARGLEDRVAAVDAEIERLAPKPKRKPRVKRED